MESKKEMRTLLSLAGFIDIEENKDGTVNATKDGIRYTKMYISDRSDISSDKDSVITQEVTVEYCK